MRRLEFRSHEFDEIAATAGIPPLVVVPGQNLDAAVADDFGVAGIDDRGVRVAFEIGGDEFFFRGSEYALHWAMGRGLQSGVYGLDVSGLLYKNGEVNDADVGRGHAHGVAIEL